MENNMEITLNNRKETIGKDQLTLSELIEFKKFTFKLLVTKVNGKLVKKEDRKNILIRDGDEVHILHMISGG
ncbi:MAG: sulfur carrier protein ThiS [Bacteroidota bacterium]